MSLATNYLDTRKWNRWEGKYTSGIFLGALVLDRQHWGDQNSASKNVYGDLSEYSNGEIRGLRLGAMGTFNFKNLGYIPFLVQPMPFQKALM